LRRQRIGRIFGLLRCKQGQHEDQSRYGGQDRGRKKCLAPVSHVASLGWTNRPKPAFYLSSGHASRGGGFAVAGVAIGVYAVGGLAIGIHTLLNDPQFVEKLRKIIRF
jgi:hypothetical protein